MHTDAHRWNAKFLICVHVCASVAMMLGLTAPVHAQTQHVAYSLDVQPNPAAPGGKALLRITAKVDPGWHIYSGSSPAGIPISFQLAPNAAIEKFRILQAPP